jgi:uncharacterized protein (TIGR02246 family)
MSPHDMIRRIEAAENSGDADASGRLLTDDVVFMVPNAPTIQGREPVVEFIRKVFAWVLERYDQHIAYTSEEIRVLEGVAFDRGTFVFTCTPKGGGAAEVNSGKYLFVYERGSDGEWRVSRAIESLDDREEEDSN